MRLVAGYRYPVGCSVSLLYILKGADGACICGGVLA